jgi:hypothetical protein
MSLANPPWGAPRIHGELLKLGIVVGQTLGRQVHGKAQETPLSRLQDVIEAIFDPIFEVRTAFVFGVVDRLEEFSVAPGATDAFRGAASGGLDQARISDARYEVDMAWIFLNPNGGPLCRLRVNAGHSPGLGRTWALGRGRRLKLRRERHIVKSAAYACQRRSRGPGPMRPWPAGTAPHKVSPGWDFREGAKFPAPGF